MTYMQLFSFFIILKADTLLFYVLGPGNGWAWADRTISRFFFILQYTCEKRAYVCEGRARCVRSGGRINGRTPLLLRRTLDSQSCVSVV